MTINNIHTHSNNKTSSVKPPIELSDILKNVIEKMPKLSKQHWKIVNDILSCRTAKLGGHVLECNICGHVEHSYNSCRNRHCPKCQALAKERWLKKRMAELLPVNYFHVVFTLPDLVNEIALRNKKIVYNIFFKSIKETLIEAAKNPKNLGADIGFLAILHTWGQNILFHPHIHCVVPAGGISDDGNNWVNTKNKKFFISVKILSKLFKGKFISYLKKAYKKNKISFVGKIEQLGKSHNFNQLINQLYKKSWVVYAKRPFGGPEKVLNYLGRYTHRIAISNHRIISYKDGKVSFKWKDYKNNNQKKIMTLDDIEFIRRFLLHVIPENFMRIRSFGYLSNRSKKEKLSQCQELLKVKGTGIEIKTEESWQDLVFELTGIDPTICKKCHKGKLFIIETIYPEKEIYKRCRFDSS